MVGIRTQRVGIEGMHCKVCVRKIESGIGSLPGVRSVKVNLLGKNAQISYEPDKTDLGKIRDKISRLGYSADKSKSKNKRSFFEGLLYGLLPHTGCIAFAAGSILGVTALTQFFRPFLMNRYFFHFLVLISLGFATLSSAVYLKRNGFLSLEGIRRKWKYLTAMYGSTVGINLFLFMVVFPLLANVSAVPAAGLGSQSAELSSLVMSVAIPCPGHAPLISGELRAVEGVSKIDFSFPNVFTVAFDSARTTREELLSLDIFKTYPATVR